MSTPAHPASRRYEKQTRYLSQAIQLEEAVNPHIIRTTMTMVSGVILAFIVWAGFTNINELARTPGEVVPHGHQQTVQHLDGGLVASIHVREGEAVAAGQLLLTLSDSGLREDMNRARGRDLTLAMQEERLRAYLAGRSPDFSDFDGADTALIADQESMFASMTQAETAEAQVIADQTAQRNHAIATLGAERDAARNSLAIAQDIYDRRMELNRRGFASDMQLLETRQRVNDLSGQIASLQSRIGEARAQIRESEARLASFGARQRDNAHMRLDQILAEKAQNAEILNKIEGQMQRLSIRAPVAGHIKGLRINTVGAIIQPGQTLMEIVPQDGKLEVQVKISPKDIGHLQIGQPVQVKFSTYDFSRYGSVRGRLEQISATTFTGDGGDRYYQGVIRLDKSYVGANPKNPVLPGMTVMADIITGEKTILQYLLKPIHLSLKTAFTER